ncbi:hypothetical protein LPJ72_003698 [Coemansia sp. Benny D160-2]|nr:hypothetical protein LPJ72_003698 [Coemansia sp. Benny D160-2]
MHSSPPTSYKQKRRLAAVHEDTALLSDDSSAQYADSANSSRQIAAGSGSKKALSPMQLLSMTVLLAGIQFVWTVELGYGTPYLLSLGLSKPLMTLVWMAGLVIQPIVGALSDRCYSKLGRRRPFIIGGAAFVVASVITIAYAKEMAEGVARIAGISANPRPGSDYQLFVTRGSIVFAVIGFYVLDFSINTSQACARALALDIPPLHQQDLANAYAGRMLNLGSVSGYMVGFMDLRTLFPWQTDSQMQALCLIATFVFVVTITWTCVSVREKPLLSDNECAIAEEEEESVDQAGSSSSRRAVVMAAAVSSSDAGVVGEWKRMFTSIAQGIVRLPTPVQRVCNVQFFAWVAWFPFLFFATTWVTEVMARSGDTSDPDFAERATRAGSFALFLYSIASLGFSMVLPVFVGDEAEQQQQQQQDLGVWGIGALVGSLRVSLRTMWRLSLLAMCGILVLTYFVSDVRGATVLIVLMAFPWSLAMWAPFALVGEYVTIASGSDGVLQAADAAAGTPPGVEDDSDEYIVSVMGGKNRTAFVAQFPPSAAGKHGSGAYGADDDSLAAAAADSVYDDHDPDPLGSDESDEFIVGSQSTATRWMLSPASVSSEWSAPANARHSGVLAQRAAAAARGDSIGSTIRGDEMSSAMPPNSSNRVSPLFLRTPLRIGEDGRMERVPEQKAPVLRRQNQNHQTRQSPELPSPELPEQQAPGKLESGAILGIHNMYVVLPQFVINAVSSLVFAWLGSSSGGDASGKAMRSAEFMAVEEVFAAMAGGGEAVGTVLRIGGASALVAAVLTVFLFDRQRVRAYVAARTGQ